MACGDDGCAVNYPFSDVKLPNIPSFSFVAGGSFVEGAANVNVFMEELTSRSNIDFRVSGIVSQQPCFHGVAHSFGTLLPRTECNDQLGFH